MVGCLLSATPGGEGEAVDNDAGCPLGVPDEERGLGAEGAVD